MNVFTSDKTTAFRAGYLACWDGKGKDTNPNPPGCVGSDEWLNGWDHCRAEVGFYSVVGE